MKDEIGAVVIRDPVDEFNVPVVAAGSGFSHPILIDETSAAFVKREVVTSGNTAYSPAYASALQETVGSGVASCARPVLSPDDLPSDAVLLRETTRAEKGLKRARAAVKHWLAERDSAAQTKDALPVGLTQRGLTVITVAILFITLVAVVASMLVLEHPIAEYVLGGVPEAELRARWIAASLAAVVYGSLALAILIAKGRVGGVVGKLAFIVLVDGLFAASFYAIRVGEDGFTWTSLGWSGFEITIAWAHAFGLAVIASHLDREATKAAAFALAKRTHAWLENRSQEALQRETEAHHSLRAHVEVLVEREQASARARTREAHARAMANVHYLTQLQALNCSYYADSPTPEPADVSEPQAAPRNGVDGLVGVVRSLRGIR